MSGPVLRERVNFQSLTDENIMTSKVKKAIDKLSKKQPEIAGICDDLLTIINENPPAQTSNEFYDELSNELDELRMRDKIREGEVQRLFKENEHLRNELLKIKSYQMINNLIFWGVKKSDKEVCSNKLRKVFALLELDPDKILIDYCHRLPGTGDSGIICRFISRKDKYKILKNCTKLKDSEYSVSEHLPPEYNEIRKELLSEKDKIKLDNPEAKISIRGNKLYNDKTILRDVDKELATCSPFDDNHTKDAMHFMKVMKRSDYIEQQGSTFQSHHVPIDNKSQIQGALAAIRTDPGTARASHNIYAVNLDDYTTHNDDGEHRAGQKLLTHIKDKGVKGLVCVTRWFGGTHMGPSRFDFILKSADGVLG